MDEISEARTGPAAERAKAAFMFAYETLAPAPVREELGIATWRIGGGVALYVDHDDASLNSAAVLPEYRRRGGQAALIERRVAAARELGCRVLVAEIDKPAPGSVNQSLNNMLRHGFMPIYERTNWVWTRS